jgi:hypothetical protein
MRPVSHLPSHPPLTASDCTFLKSPSADVIGNKIVITAGKSFGELAKKLSLQDARIAHDGSGYIMMSGHVEYHDMFSNTALHYDDWCVHIIPNNMENNVWSFPIIYERVR